MNPSSRRFHDFIAALANQRVDEDVCNQYSYDLPENAVRRNNLLRWLELMDARKPSVLLVGEAPGYKGARLTGIPFTSEKLLLNGLLGPAPLFQKTKESKIISTESTATIFWRCMEELKIIPLVWNAFPFHPFHKGNPISNRPPKLEELRIGERFLKKLVELFTIQTLIAVGKKADLVLYAMGIDHEVCRHPSKGGQKDFQRGIMKLMKK